MNQMHANCVPAERGKTSVTIINIQCRSDGHQHGVKALLCAADRRDKGGYLWLPTTGFVTERVSCVPLCAVSSLS